MASFKKQQNDFLENQGMELEAEDTSDSDSEMTATVVPVKTTTHFPSGTCIFCQEDTSDQRLYGTLALIAQSNILRSTDLKDEDYIGEVYTTPCSLDRSADAIRPFGVASAAVLGKASLQLITALDRWLLVAVISCITRVSKLTMPLRNVGSHIK